MNVFAKFDEIPSMILEVIKETKRYGHTVGRSDNVKTVYPPTNTVCGGYNNIIVTTQDVFTCPNCLKTGTLMSKIESCKRYEQNSCQHLH